jgi:hypothetical protein
VVKSISREELKAKMDRAEDFVLVDTIPESHQGRLASTAPVATMGPRYLQTGGERAVVLVKPQYATEMGR